MLLIETEIRQSKIHGLGLFCVGRVSKGTKVWEFHPLFDQVLKEEDVANLPPSMHSFLQLYAYRSVQTNELIVNLDQSRHMNHADNPCLVSDVESNYYAAYDLEPGTELTCDYREFSVSGCDFQSLDVELHAAKA
ncbi:MAG TPA: SET domain-containing protein-lysine N-methyltransferase [Dongiaceae bacterium]|nr:SET domain-containing protein-lysine N-methyltransferase [Dongiaceae bacterium]